MLTRKQYRTLKNLKPYIIIAAITIATIIIIILTNNHNKNYVNKEVEQYKQCIIQQSETRHYIIRSECSMNYAILDQLSGLEYTQIGYDLYLK